MPIPTPTWPEVCCRENMEAQRVPELKLRAARTNEMLLEML
jgi:hypothetical protein